MQNNKVLILVVVVAVLVIGFVAMRMMNQNVAPTEPASMETEVTQAAEKTTEEAMTQEGTVTQETTTEKSSESMMQESPIVVEGGNFAFEPNIIRVKKGEKVTITFKNAEGFHDFVIDEFDVATAQLQAGMEETVEFTPMEAGEYEFYCSVGKHREMGMVGTLIVE